MLQDLCVFGLLSFEEKWDDDNERAKLSKIMLTSQGLSLATRRLSTDEVMFD